ncbi:MAG: hypothetical protein RR744_08335 [Cellulosilyticaceae bacterium]
MLYDAASLERLAIIANVLQVGSFAMNAEQLSNDDIINAIADQNQNYLEVIITNQKLILEKLEKLEKNIGD